jgi:UDP-glucose 4-epimerase
VRQALRGEPITVYGTGEQRRCFGSVHDVVRGLIALPQVDAAAGQVVNLGSQEEISIRDLAHRVATLCDSPSEVRFLSYEEAYGPGFDDMARRVPDVTRAQRLIGWQPKYDVDAMIRDVAKHMLAVGDVQSSYSLTRE